MFPSVFTRLVFHIHPSSTLIPRLPLSLYHRSRTVAPLPEASQSCITYSTWKRAPSSFWFAVMFNRVGLQHTTGQKVSPWSTQCVHSAHVYGDWCARSSTRTWRYNNEKIDNIPALVNRTITKGTFSYLVLMSGCDECYGERAGFLP